ncbi:MAG: pentapeptide repeat-containing protein [Leadbetterella sp.]
MFLANEIVENTSLEDLKKQYKEFEDCTFKNMDWSEKNISLLSFENCTFENCNLSNIKVVNTAFKNVRFHQCKLLGIHFYEANPFLLEFRFENCSIDHSSFYQLKSQNSIFENCSLKDVDFTQIEFKLCKFENCNFNGAVFDDSNVEKSSFMNAANLILNPQYNTIKKAIFDKDSAMGLLHSLPIILK